MLQKALWELPLLCLGLMYDQTWVLQLLCLMQQLLWVGTLALLNCA
jgi:hypothetical protein